MEVEKDNDYFIHLTLLEMMYHIFSDEHMLSKISYIIDTPYYPEPIRKTERFILENYHKPLRIRNLVEAAMISESHLNRLYKKYFNMSPMERLAAIRMEQAAILLRDPSLTVTNVAVQVGYSSMSAFVQQFKRKFGVSPKEFQNRLE
jgi:AraC-like DNA-binding protein